MWWADVIKGIAAIVGWELARYIWTELWPRRCEVCGVGLNRKTGRGQVGDGRGRYRWACGRHMGHVTSWALKS